LALEADYVPLNPNSTNYYLYDPEQGTETVSDLVSLSERWK
jgi:hypothetical protein